MKIYSVDRIENGFAVCEDRDTKKIENIPVTEFDFSVKSSVLSTLTFICSYFGDSFANFSRNLFSLLLATNSQW